jgi:hypothetical protein
MNQTRFYAGSSGQAHTTTGALLQRKCACGATPGSMGECETCRKQHEAVTLQRAASHAAIIDPIPPAVHAVLRTPGQALDPATRGFMEPRFDRDFSSVRVHNDPKAAESARAVHALAYTVGSNLVFSAGQYRSQTNEGRRLIAHELAHVVQQTRRPYTGGRSVSHRDDAAEVEASEMAEAAVNGGASGLQAHSRPSAHLQREDAVTTPTFGTAKTTAPVAKLSPRSEMLKELTDEVALLNNAQVIVDWALKVHAKKKPAAATTDADDTPVSFSAQSLLSEKAVLKQLKPVPKTADDLAALLELLVYYDVITAPIYTSLDAAEPEHLLRIDAKTKQPNTARFAEARQKITTFTKSFEQRAKRPNPLDPVVETELLPSEMSAGSKAERKPETDAQTELAALEQQLAALEQSEASDEASQTKQLELQAKIAKAKEKLRVAGGYHTFAGPVVNLLKRLRQLNTTWKAGTYVGHSWGEFSADIFLSANLITVNDADEYSGQYWDRTVVRQFFDDLNTVAEQDDPTTGRFAWRAIYNDKPLAVEINKKFGAGRVIHVENHGPAPDHKLHIHLDLRPVTLQPDEKRGYQQNQGRIELL